MTDNNMDGHHPKDMDGHDLPKWALDHLNPTDGGCEFTSITTMHRYGPLADESPLTMSFLGSLVCGELGSLMVTAGFRNDSGVMQAPIAENVDIIIACKKYAVVMHMTVAWELVLHLPPENIVSAGIERALDALCAETGIAHPRETGA